MDIAKQLEKSRAEIAKFQATGGSAPAVTKDPMQRPAPTQTEVSAQSVASGNPGTNAVASNLSAVVKRIEEAVAEVEPLVKDKTGDVADAARDAISKASTATAKLAEIGASMNMDLASANMDDYDTRWKVSKLIGMLQEAAMLETLLGTPAAKTADDGVQKSAGEVMWPSDMAAAKFVGGKYSDPDAIWGADEK